MLVQLNSRYLRLRINVGRENLELVTGDKIQLFGPQLAQLIKEGIVEKTEYSGFINNEIVTVAFEDSVGWRPIGQTEKRN